MNTIALIEDKERDFNSVKNIFSDTSKQIWPDYHKFWKDVSPDNDNSVSDDHESVLMNNICKQIENNIDNTSAIIMDLALYSDNDELGINIIKQLRQREECKFKLIPIFCYSKWGGNADIRKKALAAGATNIFSKEVVDNTGLDAKKNIAELKISVDSQMMAYQIAQYSISSLERVEDYLAEDAKKTDFLVEGLVSLMKLDKINEITDNKEIEKMLVDVFGGQGKLTEVKKKMDQLETKYNQTDFLEDISGLLSLIPGLNLVSAFPKIVSMMRKNTN